MCGTGAEGYTASKENPLRRAVSDALTKRGYTRAGRMHVKRLTADISWVVDTGPLNAGDDIAPFVGIRHDGIEETVASLLDIEVDPVVASVGDNVGYIVSGTHQVWRGRNHVPDVLSAIELAQNRLLPFLSLKTLFLAWNVVSRNVDPAWRYREIAWFLLLGESKAILPALEVARGAFCEYDDEVCDQFKGFERRVRERLGSQ
jgi:hypothetical protein